MQALADSPIGHSIGVVISNNPHAEGLAIAQAKGFATAVIDHRQYENREKFEQSLIQVLERYAPRLVVLAGFMRVLTPTFIHHYQGRLINIHPSLLPALAGLRTHERALASGTKFHGCTVHFVSEEVDGGAIIAQAALSVLPTDTADTLAKRVLKLEHQLLPWVVQAFLAGDFVEEKNRVVWHKTPPSDPNDFRFSPPLMV